MVKPSAHLLEYLANQNIDVSDIVDHLGNETLEEKVEEAKEDKDDTTIPQTIASKPVQQEEKKVDEKDLGYSVMSDPSGEKLETEPPAPNTMFNSNNKQENIVNQNVNVETQAQVQPENQNQQQTIETQAVNQNIFPENQSIGITPQINNNNLVGNINSNEIVHPINNNNSIEQTNILPQTPTAQIFPESNLNSENNVVNTMENTTNNINESVQTQSTNVAQPLPQSNIGLGNTLMSGNNQNSLFDANNSDVNNENNVNEKPQGIINTLSVDDILNGQG